MFYNLIDQFLGEFMIHMFVFRLLAIFHMKHKNMKHKSIQGVYYVSGMRHNSQGVLVRFSFQLYL